MKPTVSILIVHAFATGKLRQTLRGIRRAAPTIPYEVIIVDNTPELGMHAIIQSEFPEVVYAQTEKNIGFGAGMNRAFNMASGSYVLIFNPDIIIEPGSIESLVSYMDANTDIGLIGPKLVNPNGTLQYSCHRLPTWFLPVFRRTPFGRTKLGRRIMDHYFMKDVAHDSVMDVDSLLGGAMLARRTAFQDVGLFDEQFFLYYEDNDLCRRFWESGYRVVYYPHAEMMHYHRRQAADGGLIRQLTNWTTWVQISSFFKYMKKYHRKENPRLAHESRSQHESAG